MTLTVLCEFLNIFLCNGVQQETLHINGVVANRLVADHDIYSQMLL